MLVRLLSLRGGQHFACEKGCALHRLSTNSSSARFDSGTSRPHPFVVFVKERSAPDNISSIKLLNLATAHAGLDREQKCNRHLMTLRRHFLPFHIAHLRAPRRNLAHVNSAGSRTRPFGLAHAFKRPLTEPALRVLRNLQDRMAISSAVTSEICLCLNGTSIGAK